MRLPRTASTILESAFSTLESFQISATAQVSRLRSNSFSYSSTRTGFADCSASCCRSSLNAFDVGLDVQRLVSHRIDVLAGRARSAGKSVYDLHQGLSIKPLVTRGQGLILDRYWNHAWERQQREIVTALAVGAGECGSKGAFAHIVDALQDNER